MTNRGTFPPFRVAATAQLLCEKLFGDRSDTTASALGVDVGQQGLGLPALLAAQTVALQTVADAEVLAESALSVSTTSHFFGLVLEGLITAQATEGERQRAVLEQTYLNAVAEQHKQEDALRSTISELSTPIIPIYTGILALPSIGVIDSRRAAEITERLLETIAKHQAEIVIIDITGVELVDTSTANHLLMTTQAANLLSSQVVLVGIGADIAQTIVHLGVELQGLITLANLQAGLAYALRKRGFGIQPLPERRAQGVSGAVFG